MKCGRVQLQERSNALARDVKTVCMDKPRRICQKRLVDPDHQEDPRWADVLDRFCCDESIDTETIPTGNVTSDRNTPEELFLSVQTLRFQGAEEPKEGRLKRPRTAFKYRTVIDGNLHRMFVKQSVSNEDLTDDDRSSQLTYYYYDDYVQYLTNTDKSRPSSTKSSISTGPGTELRLNKAVQVDFSKNIDTAKPRKREGKPVNPKANVTDVGELSIAEKIEDTKISYRNSGKKKSLTISRAQSPETVQVIRVDVVCNNGASTSTVSECEDSSKDAQIHDKNTEIINIKNSHYANKYLPTNTIKSLDEKISGGAKVTLLCKTFTLTDRPRMLFNKKPMVTETVASKTKVSK